MSVIAQGFLIVVVILACAIWIGGYVTVIVVSAITRKTLDGRTRVDFFRRFGAAIFAVTIPALLVAYASGWTLLARLPWSGGLTRMAVGSAALLLVVVVGVIQARDLTRLRRRLAAEAGNDNLARTIRKRAHAATAARGLIGILTLGLVINTAVLLTHIT